MPGCQRLSSAPPAGSPVHPVVPRLSRCIQRPGFLHTLAFSFLIACQITLPATADAGADPEQDKLPQTEFHFGTAIRDPYSNPAGTGICDLLVTEAFRRLNLVAVVEHLPAERSLLLANEGVMDGDLMRVPGLDAAFPNLVRVPESLVQFEFVAFAKDATSEAVSWESLKQRQVGLVRGWKILEEHTRTFPFVTRVSTPGLVFALLDSGRADAVLYERLSGQFQLESMGIFGVQAMEPPIEKRGMFLYLHRRHELRVPDILRVLQDMKTDGTYKRLATTALEQRGMTLPSDWIDSSPVAPPDPRLPPGEFGSSLQGE